MITKKIYTLVDPISGHVKYVGKTHNIKERKNRHNAISNKSNKEKQKWVKELRSMNLKPIIEEIDFMVDGGFDFEMYWIEQMKVWGFDVFNVPKSKVGEKISNSLVGKIRTNEHKANLSKSSKKYVYEVFLNGCFIKEVKSLLEVKEMTNISLSHLSRLVKSGDSNSFGYTIKRNLPLP